jgi:methylglyoxal synthase
MTEILPYSLQSAHHSSDQYYRDIAPLADRWLAYSRETAGPLIDDFRAFLQSEGRPDRSFEACALELLALGVLLQEHGRQAANLPGWAAWLLAKLVALQSRWPGAERAIKRGRGLITGALGDTATQLQGAFTADEGDNPAEAVATLIRWLQSHDEPGQAERFAAWQEYLATIDRKQARQVIGRSLSLADDFARDSQPVLGPYTTGVEPYRTETACRSCFRYDAELLTRSRLEYHLGLLGTEILNRVYRNRFEATAQKLVIVPLCLRTPPAGEVCQAEQTPLGGTCRNCHPACRVNQLTRLGQQQGFLVCCIPDDELGQVCLASGQAGRGDLGVIGISCALAEHILIGTGTTGRLLEQTLGIEVIKLQSGPLGGDQQIGAKIAEGDIDFAIFFWDPLEAQPHDPDVKALLRLAVVWNIPIACNRASADFMFSSPLMNESYQRILPDYETYRRRVVAEVEQIVPADLPPVKDFPPENLNP